MINRQTQVIRWQEATLPDEHVLRQRMHEEGLSPYTWSNGPYDTYAIHNHDYEKVLYCLRGSIRFVIHDVSETERNVDLGPGDCMLLPRSIRHSAQVGSQGVTCLEAARY